MVIPTQVGAASAYNDLGSLFAEWRSFEQPPMRDGAPDYTAATLKKKQAGLKALQTRLDAIDPSRWPVDQQVDYDIVRAEMNGLDFNLRVLRPWERDPAFYVSLWTAQSDTPAHEGPAHHALIELWAYQFPLTPADQDRLADQLRGIAPLLAQARINLTGNARDLWMAGIGTVRQQAKDLEALEQATAGSQKDLRQAIGEAREATARFITWLETQGPAKTGPSGIGKEHYTWNLRHVHLVPLSWEEEVTLLKRELARAHAGLKLEEQRNRQLPPMRVITSEEEFQRRGNEAVTKYMKFLAEQQIMPIRGYMDPALRAQIGRYEPEATRNFFAMATHREPLTLYTHFYHWWDLAQMREEPHASAIRRGPLLFNIWDSRAEGMATAMEEMMLHAGLFDDQPRAREIVWIMLAQRAARGLGSLYAQANEFTMKQAADFHVKWTPRGWMRPDLDLLGFEQHLYLRQPGYGTSYITGKILLEELMRVRSLQLGEGFSLNGYFAEVNAAGLIPVSLIRWQMTGQREEIDASIRSSQQ
jgi:uncharacterized protein (DUF885 family)